jgi:N utilization substance protein B
MSRSDPAGRRRAREAALQMLYQWEVGRMGPYEVVATYWPSQDPDHEVGDEPRAFANALVKGTIERVAEIDALVSAHTHHWRLERMAAIERLVLRLGVFELLTAPDVPAKVVINEALELTRTYSGDEAVAFVNGVLDAVRKELKRE